MLFLAFNVTFMTISPDKPALDGESSSHLPLANASTASALTAAALLVACGGGGSDTQGSGAKTVSTSPDGVSGETVAVVPVSMLSWHRVEIPKGVGMNSPLPANMLRSA